MHQVVNDDCIQHMRSMTPDAVDVCVTSPPYNIGIKYNAYQDDLETDDYLDWIHRVGSEIKRILKPGGSFFLNVGSSNREPWRAMDVAYKLRSLFTLQNEIVWVKSLTVEEESYGHFKPINSKRFLNHNHERIYHFTLSGDVPIDRLAVGVPYQDKSNIKRWKHAKADRRCGGNVWYIPYKTVQSKSEKFNHPAGFPVELPRRCILLHGLSPDMVVIDPFLGAGTTLEACELLKVHGIGIDLDEKYCSVARERLNKLV